MTTTNSPVVPTFRPTAFGVLPVGGLHRQCRPEEACCYCSCCWCCEPYCLLMQTVVTGRKLRCEH